MIVIYYSVSIIFWGVMIKLLHAFVNRQTQSRCAVYFKVFVFTTLFNFSLTTPSLIFITSKLYILLPRRDDRILPLASQLQIQCRSLPQSLKLPSSFFFVKFGVSGDDEQMIGSRWVGQHYVLLLSTAYNLLSINSSRSDVRPYLRAYKCRGIYFCRKTELMATKCVNFLKVEA